jgi:methylenetetrahydrofolate dehydrogenase (NADP+)/methenyltetrahydrofolate cyclohydrolase
VPGVVKIAHCFTSNLMEHCERADILVMVVRRPEMVRRDWIKAEATVIDVGINLVERDKNYRLVGDYQRSHVYHPCHVLQSCVAVFVVDKPNPVWAK